MVYNYQSVRKLLVTIAVSVIQVKTILLISKKPYHSVRRLIRNVLHSNFCIVHHIFIENCMRVIQ